MQCGQFYSWVQVQQVIICFIFIAFSLFLCFVLLGQPLSQSFSSSDLFQTLPSTRCQNAHSQWCLLTCPFPHHPHYSMSALIFLSITTANTPNPAMEPLRGLRKAHGDQSSGGYPVSRRCPGVGHSLPGFDADMAMRQQLVSKICHRTHHWSVPNSRALQQYHQRLLGHSRDSVGVSWVATETALLSCMGLGGAVLKTFLLPYGTMSRVLKRETSKRNSRSVVSKRHNLAADLLVLQLVDYFCSFFRCSLSLRYRSCVVDGSFAAGQSTINTKNNFDQL